MTIDVSPDLLRRQITLHASWTFSTLLQAECARFIVDRRCRLSACSPTASASRRPRRPTGASTPRRPARACSSRNGMDGRVVHINVSGGGVPKRPVPTARVPGPARGRRPPGPRSSRRCRPCALPLRARADRGAPGGRPSGRAGRPRREPHGGEPRLAPGAAGRRLPPGSDRPRPDHAVHQPVSERAARVSRRRLLAGVRESGTRDGAASMRASSSRGRSRSETGWSAWRPPRRGLASRARKADA